MELLTQGQSIISQPRIADARAPPGQFFLASTSALGLYPLCAHGALSVEALSCVRAMRRVGPSLALHLLGGKLTKDRSWRPPVWMRRCWS